MEDDTLHPRRLGRRDVNAREEMEAGPSVTTEDSVVGNLQLERLEQKHNIFLSYNGSQKEFVRRLRNALVHNAYLPFFDEDPDSLPKGEPFAQRLKDAARLTDVAVVVLSDEFFVSKWPMIELDIFIEEQRRRKRVLECKELNIFPLFMGLSVEEFRDPDRRLGWLKQWDELASEDSRIDACKWKEALVVLGNTNGIQYRDFRTEEEYIKNIVSAILKLVPPDLKWEDTHVKGKSKLCQAVAKMFAKAPPKTRFHNVRTIGLYGTGGIGKTTVCKLLCNEYFAEFNGKVWHAELDKKGAKEIQKDVLRHLVGISETLLNQKDKSKDQWRSLLRRKIQHKVFLAIDNVWNEDAFREQAEALLGIGFHPNSLVIVTSRSRELLEWLGIHKECCFEMPELDKDDATAVLLQSAAPGHDIQSMTDDQRIAVDKVVERCFLAKGSISGETVCCEKQYVPLALEVLGRQLRLPLREYSSPKLTRWVDKLDLKRSDQKPHPIFSVLGLSYDNLPSPKHKSIFLDVALCAPRQQDDFSASVNEVCKWLSLVYGEGVDNILEFLEILQRDGLVERWENLASPFGMHELYYEFAKAEAGNEENFDKQFCLYHEDGLHVPAIMQMLPRHNCWPLRRLRLYNGGFSQLSSGELQYIVHVEVLRLYFCFELELLDLQCLKSLRSLEIRGCFELRMVKGLKDLKHLKFFRWNTCRIPGVALDFPQAVKIVEIYGSKESEGPATYSLQGCGGILELTLSRHPLLPAVPDLCKHDLLEKVDFSGCCKIIEVRGLGSLQCLRHLNLQNCNNLRHCICLEKLVKIETLNLKGCQRLRLPEVWDLTELINLRCIDIGGSSVVQKLVFNSRHLALLKVDGCTKLKTVELSAESWPICIERLTDDWATRARQWTFECRSLNVLYWPIHENSLTFSEYNNIPSLGDIALFTYLQHLDFQNCTMLTTVPDVWDLSPLVSLRTIRISGNDVVRQLVLGSPYLEELEIDECPNLSTVVLRRDPWKCLARLNGSLNEERLDKVALWHEVFSGKEPWVDRPFMGGYCQGWTFECKSAVDCNSFEAYIVLNLSNCYTLESLDDIRSLRLLQYFVLRNCGRLMRLPDVSDLPVLQMLDLSWCTMLEDLDEVGAFSGLRYLFLEGCKSLTSLGDLGRFPCLEMLDVQGCVNLRGFPKCTTWDLSKLVSLRGLRIGDNDVVRELVLDNPQLELLSVKDCACLRTVSAISFSMSNNGSLRSLRFLYIRSCGMLTALPDLSNSGSLGVVDLSNCCTFDHLGDLGLLRSLQYLYLRGCTSVTSFGCLGGPSLKLLDLSGCSKLESLGDFDFLRSLQWLDLSYCKLPIVLPILSTFPLLKVLDITGYVNIGALAQMTSTNLVIDVSKCVMLTEFLVKDGLVRDVAGAVLEIVCKWKSQCKFRVASVTSDSACIENVREGWEDWVECGNTSAAPHENGEALELICVSEKEVDILYRQRVFLGERAFLRLRLYTFPASILSAMSRECFVSCIHVRSWVDNLVAFGCCC